MRRVAAANVYFATTRLRSWGLNASDGTLEGNGLKPSPCGFLAIGAGAGVAIGNDVTEAARSCHDWLHNKFGPLGSSVYSLDAAARDLALQIQAVRAAHNDASDVYVMAMGRTSRIVQTFLALGSAAPPLAGVVFDSPHALHLTATSDADAGASASRFLDGCGSDETCRRNFDALGTSLRDVVDRLLLPLDQKSLRRSVSKCAQVLVTAAFDEQRDLAPSHGVRRYLAAVRREPTLARLLPVLLYRLHRCHEQDAAMFERLSEDLLGAAGATAASRATEFAQTRFAEQVVAFSDVWPQDVPAWQQLVRAFESAPMGDGAMVQQQPTFCLYAGDMSPACAEMYERARKPNASLVLSYPRGPLATAAAKPASPPSNVLLLASRLSVDGADAVASRLYDAFSASSPGPSSLVLVETDTIEETELRVGATYIDQLTGVLDTTYNATSAAFRLLDLFFTGKLRSASGKWRLNDLVAADATATATELPATLTSTYGKAPVALNLTLSPDDIAMWFPDDQQDPYASHLTIAVSDGGLSIWYVALLVVVAVGVLVGCVCFLRVSRRKRRLRAARDEPQLATPATDD